MGDENNNSNVIIIIVHHHASSPLVLSCSFPLLPSFPSLRTSITCPYHCLLCPPGPSSFRWLLFLNSECSSCNDFAIIMSRPPQLLTSSFDWCIVVWCHFHWMPPFMSGDCYFGRQAEWVQWCCWDVNGACMIDNACNRWQSNVVDNCNIAQHWWSCNR